MSICSSSAHACAVSSANRSPATHGNLPGGALSPEKMIQERLSNTPLRHYWPTQETNDPVHPLPALCNCASNIQPYSEAERMGNFTKDTSSTLRVLLE